GPRSLALRARHSRRPRAPSSFETKTPGDADASARVVTFVGVVAALALDPAVKAAPSATPASIEPPARTPITAFLASILCLLSFALWAHPTVRPDRTTGMRVA